ncbi:lipopolysaccharide biosynthesis protein [Azonexus sp.]|uniref:lipopolysaccharide biosynthesis protein n=1 Tax=Azonexus sp. TaxID=1872668 RepID=UPI0035B4B7D6
MKKNFLFTSISIGSRLLTGLVIFVLLARLWGPTDFGVFSFVFSACALLTLIVDFGFAGYLLREVGAEPGKAGRLIKDALWAKLSLLIILLLAASATGALLGAPVFPLQLALPLLLAAITLSFADFFLAPLRALGRYDAETGIVTSTNALQFVIAGSVACSGGSPIAVAWAFFASRMFYLTLAIHVLRRVIPSLSLGKSGATAPHRTFKRVWSYGIDGALTTAWGQLDVIVVRALYGTQAVGIYAAGQKIVQGVSALAPVVGNVMIPNLARQARSGDPRFQRTSMLTAAAMLGIGGLFAAPMLAMPEQVSALLFGDKFQGLGQLLPFFALILALKYLAAGAGIVITSAGLQAKRVITQFISMMVFAILITFVICSGMDIKFFLISYAVSMFLFGILNARYWLRFSNSIAL